MQAALVVAEPAHVAAIVTLVRIRQLVAVAVLTGMAAPDNLEDQVAVVLDRDQ